jgi:hypothetical protein
MTPGPYLPTCGLRIPPSSRRLRFFDASIAPLLGAYGSRALAGAFTWLTPARASLLVFLSSQSHKCVEQRLEIFGFLDEMLLNPVHRRALPRRGIFRGLFLEVVQHLDRNIQQ